MCTNDKDGLSERVETKESGSTGKNCPQGWWGRVVPARYGNTGY